MQRFLVLVLLLLGNQNLVNRLESGKSASQILKRETLKYVRISMLEKNKKLNSQPETEEMRIEGSPFRLVKENEKWFAAWGQGKMTMDFNTHEEVLEWIENNYWNFLITVLTMAMDSRDLYRISQIQKQTKQQMEKYAETNPEHTLHGEIERLKQEEAQEYPELHELNERMKETANRKKQKKEERQIEVKDKYANKLKYKTYQ